MQLKTTEFNSQFWRLRALFIPDAPFEDGETRDQFVWFIATPTIDRWLSLALSDTADDEVAQKILAAVDQGKQHALAIFVGEPWSIIETDPIPHSMMMREIVGALDDELTERLLSMSEDEILAIRDSEEAMDAWLSQSN